jgi:hypothetical protein
MVHKLFAVPESVYRMSRPSDSDGMQSVLADLERQMIVINQNRSLSQEERFLRYNQIWIRYQDIRKRLAEKPMHVTLDDATLDKMRAMANASPPPPPPFDNLNRIDRFLRPILHFNLDFSLRHFSRDFSLRRFNLRHFNNRTMVIAKTKVAECFTHRMAEHYGQVGLHRLHRHVSHTLNLVRLPPSQPL